MQCSRSLIPRLSWGSGKESLVPTAYACANLPTKHGKPGFIPRWSCEGLKTNTRPIYLIEIPQTPSLFDDKVFLEHIRGLSITKPYNPEYSTANLRRFWRMRTQWLPGSLPPPQESLETRLVLGLAVTKTLKKCPASLISTAYHTLKY